MENNSIQPAAAETGTQEPQNVSGKTEAQAKEKTEPLKEDAAKGTDQEEGNMNNGELGSGMGKM
jgi:hypothetical protein